MNKIFRVVWSHATQSWVAVSELTKAHKKAGTSKSTITSIVAASVMSVAGVAAAAIPPGNGSGVSIGNNAAANGSNISIGTSAGADSNVWGINNIRIGQNSKTGKVGTEVNQSVAIGGGNNTNEGAWAEGDQSISIGGNSHAQGHSSVAIGGDDVDKVVNERINYTNADDVKTNGSIGDAYKNLTGKVLNSPQYSDTISGHAGVAVGTKSQAGHLSVAIGTGAIAGTKPHPSNSHETEFAYVNTVAIGAGANADVDNAIAIGGGANTAKRGTREIEATIGTLKYKWSGGEKIAAGDVVSFGAAGYERQLKNIAPGEVSRTSTDGINGSQLFGILDTLVTHNYLKYAGDDAQTGSDKEKKNHQPKP